MRLRFISWLYISFTIILLFLSSNAWTKSISHSLPEIRVLQTRYGEHDNFSRIVLDLNKRIEYKILKITDESYDVELFGFQRDDIEDYYPAENKHIEKIQYSKSDNKLIAHIIFKKPSYVLKDFRLENTDRIVIDFSDSTRINDVGIVSKTKIDKKDSYVKSENEVDPNTKEKSAIESKVNQIKISSSETDKPIAERFEGNADEINEKYDVVLSTEDDINSDKSNIKSLMTGSLLSLTKVPTDLNNYEYKQDQVTDNKINYIKTNISDTDNIELYFPLYENADKFRFQQFFKDQYTDEQITNNFYQLTIKQHQVAVTDNKESEYFGKWGFTKINIDPIFLNGLLSIESEMAYNPENNLDFANYMIDGYQTYKNNMSSIKLHGSYGGFDYGARYLYVNDRFNRVPGTKIVSDQQGGELWIYKKTNMFSLRTFYSNYFDNVGNIEDKDRKTISKIGATFGIEPENLPQLFVTYSKGTLTKSRTSNSSVVNKEDVDNLSTYIAYYRSNWGLYLSGDYSQGVSVYDSDSTSKLAYYYVGGYYYPTENINISPSIGFGKEEYVWIGGSLDYMSPTASLLLEYKSLYKDLDLSSYISYYKYYDPQGSLDINTIDAKASIAWNNKKTNNLLDRVALEFSYLPYDYNSNREVALLLNIRLKNL